MFTLKVKKQIGEWCYSVEQQLQVCHNLLSQIFRLRISNYMPVIKNILFLKNRPEFCDLPVSELKKILNH